MAIQVFLEPGNLDVEPKNFRRGWMPVSKLLRSVYTILPRGRAHGAIIISEFE
jgi:hypothetical protein